MISTPKPPATPPITLRRAKSVARAASALDHPLRVRIIDELVREGGRLSPKDLSTRLGEPLTNVSYHVRQLRLCGAIKLDGTRPRRGALEHYYRATPLAVRVLAASEAM